ncbi:MAG TPA: 1-acyl-sn-glycerol-3-phosphate acyltransferase [Candidatus Dormibacteraeota bacterium]|nr:1-acyl-sn-glycerol-3-phosphate acyltransferase [Candidatus Dormibacteraeota bacterium]
MSDTSGEAAGASLRPSVADYDVPEFGPNFWGRRIVDITVGLARLAMHPETHFEDEAAIRKHRDQRGVLEILATHFSRLEPGVIAQLAGKHESLSHLKYTTGVTARTELWDIPVLGRLLRSIDAAPVKRTIERPNETDAERADRQEANQRQQAKAGRRMARGNNWIIWPEGNSKRSAEVNGQLVRVKRDPKTLLPIRNGFVYSLEAMTEEERARVKLLAITCYYGERALSGLRPTVYIGKPVAPVEGEREEVRQQGEALMRRGLAEAIRLDELRQ